MKTIITHSKNKLKNGVILMDDENYDWLNEYNWYLDKDKYAITNVIINNKKTTKKMHRLIMDEPKNMQIDHIDNNKLNNQKHNLRIVNAQQNQMNRVSNKNSSSIYKGVSYAKRYKKWQSRIIFDRKTIFLGYFINEKDAAIAYNKMAEKIFKEYALLNEV